MTIDSIKKQVVPTLKQGGAVKIAIFGSFATGEAKRTSDIDILVQFKNSIGLLKLAHLKFKIEDKVGRKVDLLTYDSINPHLKNIVLKEQKIIYEKRS